VTISSRGATACTATPTRSFFSAESATLRASVMQPVIHRSAIGHRPPSPPSRASTASSRTTMTTAASTTRGRIGAVQSHRSGVCAEASGVTVRIE
jgi:hypothetical protein